MSSRFILPFADVGSGIKPSSGAKLFFYEVDGVTLKDTYSDQLSTPTPNTNPVISDSNGLFGDIYIDGTYKVTLKNKNDSLIFSLARVDSETGSGAVSLTTSGLISSTSSIATDVVVSTSGFAVSGDGGGGSWVQNGVTGQTPSQTPAQLGDVLLNDGNGVQWALVFDGTIQVTSLGGVGDNTADNTIVCQAAINALSAGGADKGGVLRLSSGIWMVSGLQLKGRVIIAGDGRGATIIKALPNSNGDLLTISDDASMCGWFSLTLDGNRANNTGNRGIVIASVGSSEGDSYQPYNNKVDNPPYSYKHIIANDFTVGNFDNDGIYHNHSNFQVFYDNFSVSHNGRDGLSVFSSDGIYSNFYIEKNDRCGLYASGSANKFSTGKVIWNGRTDKTYGNFRDQSTRNVYRGVEAQDSYTDGILILGEYPIFIGCTSNRNGYLAVGAENQSDRQSADIRIGSTAVGITYIAGSAYTYAASVGSDGFWTTEWPYYFNS